MAFDGARQVRELKEISPEKCLTLRQAQGEEAPYPPAELLTLVRQEMERSMGFENDQILRADRLRALDMYKGDMRAEIPSLPNRSRAVSTDVADAVETILPDLMEIFVSCGDVASFAPVKPGDEAAARQESQYLHHVIFQDNPGFLNLYTGFKDGLLLKTCLFEFGWRRDFRDESFAGKTLPELIAAHRDGQILNVKADAANADQPNAPQTYSFTVRTDQSGAEYWPLPPDDFSCAPETVRLAEATYCCARYRPRVQDLIAEGYDSHVVKALEPYAAVGDQQMQTARDTAGEHTQSQYADDSNEMLRQVEIRKHYIRLLDGDGDCFGIWRVVTDPTCARIVPFDGQAAQKMERVPFAGGSPWLVAHRFYGLSLAEQLFETQKIKTVLTRALLDSSYFALNQRFEVSMASANDYTISDLLRNEPGVPIRSRDGNAIKPLESSGPGFDAYAALEYFSVQGESRSGVVRNAQGLNPDTLHDTATGALALMNAAQRRVRMIARILAETCLKELYLGLHALIREHAEAARVAMLNGAWVTIDPTSWGERNAMTIEAGLGAAGFEQELAALTAISQDVAQIVTLQQGLNGPLVTAENVYNLAIDKARALRRKQPERYFSNPAAMPAQAPAQPQMPPELAAQLQANNLQAQAAQMKAATAERGQNLDAALKKYEIDQKTRADLIAAAMRAKAGKTP
jgi:hypothetical protein